MTVVVADGSSQGNRAPGARMRLLDAGVAVIRAKGLNATTVDDVCATAGVTKGAFFHHFESKEAYAVAAADHWSTTTSVLFDQATYHEHDDPVDRILGYVDFRASLIDGASPAEYSCLVGTMSQEAFETSPDIRVACGASILGHAATLEADIAAALALADRHPDGDRHPDTDRDRDPDADRHPDADRDPDRDGDAASLARYTQVVLQGAFVVSKAAADPAVALDAIGHLRRYLELVLHPSTPATS